AVFDITKYGAKADGATDNVQAIMQAWNAACKAGGQAKVVIPTGTFLAGPVMFQGPCKGPMVIEVQGTLKASTDVSQYTDNLWFGFEAINGLSITGTGTFDGQGGSVWKYNDCDTNSNCKMLPSSLHFARVSNAVIDGINSLNAMAFHFHLYGCTNITIKNVHITAPANSPNTDGIHVSISTLVNITNTVIGTGDDCISIGQGAHKVNMYKVTCGPGHGLSVGSLGKYKNEQDVTEITATNCTLIETTNGARIKTWAGSPPSKATSITFQDIIMKNVKNPVIIDQKYGSHSGQPSQVKISDVHFRNIRGTSTSNIAVSLGCSSMVPCDGVEVADIDLSYVGIKKVTALTSACLNAKAKFSGKMNPPACA
ncbi:Glyco_hydro_28 domain-containing protein, partial [Cephalotus follicularis]